MTGASANGVQMWSGTPWRLMRIEGASKLSLALIRAIHLPPPSLALNGTR